MGGEGADVGEGADEVLEDGRTLVADTLFHLACVALRMELLTSYMLSRCSTTKLHPCGDVF